MRTIQNSCNLLSLTPGKLNPAFTKVSIGTIRYSAKETAALIKKELERNWPGIEFKVAFSKLTNGEYSTEIYYNDGPTPKQIKRAIRKFSTEGEMAIGESGQLNRIIYAPLNPEPARFYSGKYSWCCCHDIDLTTGAPGVKEQMESFLRWINKYKPDAVGVLFERSGSFLIQTTASFDQFRIDNLRESFTSQGMHFEFTQEGKFNMLAFMTKEIQEEWNALAVA